MALNRFILLFMIIFSAPAFAQEKFLSICREPLGNDVPIVNDMKWLKHHFKTNDCQKIATELSKLTSFNEFMVPEVRSPTSPLTWSNDFYYLSGLTSNLSLDILPWSKLGFEPLYDNIFRYPTIYSEFKNLTVLDFTKGFYFKGIDDLCKINKFFPHVKTIVVDYLELLNLERCKDYSKIPWIIVLHSSGKGITKLHSRVIGFKDFSGSIKNLIKFRHLRYLGISNATDDNDMRFLSKNINLTHLSLNVRTEVQNLSDLRELRNLRFLILSCARDVKVNQEPYDVETKILSLTPCEKPFVKDISFLAELPWLENLSLVANSLEDVSVIAKIKRLKSLNLSYNNISSFPDLGHLKELRYVDFSHNPGSP